MIAIGGFDLPITFYCRFWRYELPCGDIVELIYILDESYPSRMSNNCVSADYYDSYKAQFHCYGGCDMDQIYNTSGCNDVKPRKFLLMSSRQLVLVCVLLPFASVTILVVATFIHFKRRNEHERLRGFLDMWTCALAIL